MKGKVKGCLIGVLIFFACIILLAIIGSLLPKSADKIYQEAQEKFNVNEFEEALVTINEAIKIDSTNSNYYKLRGKILFELQDTIHSDEDFDRTLFLSNSDLEKDSIIKDLIDWNFKHKDEEKTRKLLKKQIELHKKDSLKHIDVVEFAIRQYLLIGDTIEVINLYSMLSDEYPKVARFSNQVGVLHSILKQDKKAIIEFKKALEIEPNNTIYLFNLGVSYLNVKDFQNAKIHFKKGMELGDKKACLEYRELTAITKYYKRSKCCDGTTSSTVGRGACSHHGGVCGLENVPYKEYTINCN